MKQKGKNNWFILMVLFVFLSVAITAGCGGGGGDGDGGSSDSGISYTGSREQATINSTDAEQIITSAYQGGSVGAVVGIVQNSTTNYSGQPRTFIVIQSLENVIEKIDISDSIASGAIQTESGTINGNCGGSASYSISYDDQTGSFNGTFTYNNYCNNGSTVSGSVGVSGQIDLNTDTITQFNVSFNTLTFTSGNDSFTISGTISATSSDPTTSVTMNILLRDNITRKVYWLENYTCTVTSEATYVDLQVSGRFYHPDYGYIVLSTPTPFRIYTGNMWPPQGVLIVEGRPGSAGGNTKARLAALSSTQYQVDADMDGDGVFDDYNSGPRDWSSI